jgi:hypothetical protein
MHFVILFDWWSSSEDVGLLYLQKDFCRRDERADNRQRVSELYETYERKKGLTTRCDCKKYFCSRRYQISVKKKGIKADFVLILINQSFCRPITISFQFFLQRDQDSKKLPP